MGINFDGTYHDDIDITTVDGALACAVMGLFLIWTFIVIGVVVRDVMASPKKMTSKNLLVVQLIFLLFEILQIIINTPLCTPFLFWLTNIVGSFALLLINIAQVSRVNVDASAEIILRVIEKADSAHLGYTTQYRHLLVYNNDAG